MANFSRLKLTFKKVKVHFMRDSLILATIRNIPHHLLKEDEIDRQYYDVALKEAERRGISRDDPSVIWAKETMELFENKQSVKLSMDDQSGDLSQDAGGIKKLMECIAGRQSIRFWENKEVDESKVSQLISAAVEAPCSCNRQPWSFLVIRSKPEREFISEVRGSKFIKDAPVHILVMVDSKVYYGHEKEYTPYMDGSAAIQNILLAAHQLGLGACWVNFCKEVVPEKRAVLVRRRFNIPEDQILISLVVLGYPNPFKKHKKPYRRSLSGMVYFDQFKKK